MPFKSSKIKIENTEFDRRIKLSDDTKELIVHLREAEKLSYRKLAVMFNVSPRLIQFVINPEKLAQNKKKRADRGGEKQYYNTDKNRESTKEHRNYKESLKNQGLIKNEPEEKKDEEKEKPEKK